MRRTNDFVTESIKIGRIVRAISESSLGQLIFRDEDFPQGVRLRDFFTSQSLYAISGALNQRIEDVEFDIEVLQSLITSLSGFSISGGDLLTVIDDVEKNENDIETINTELDGFDTQFSNIESTLVGLSGSGENQVKVDNDGNLQRHPYSPIIGGKVELNTSQFIYEITDSNISDTSNPVCTILSPMSGSAIIPHYIYDITNGSFKIELSTVPPTTGYKMHWVSLEIT
jgi:hypothetical protein